ncbi:MAG TPA: hypothetical protein VEH57_05505 [Thermoplasmata archaeon]|nr:hypothetical protein [Thermoplasmata archaeon]
MATSSAPAPDIEWRSSVRVTEDHELAREVTERFAHGSGLRAVPVTDLVDPRKAFWRRLGPPVEFAPERRAAVEVGRAVHQLVGRALANEGPLEVRVRREGVVGRIDLLADLPTEVKSGSSTVDPAELRELRPDHVEQLAMYCALLDRRAGRLLQFLTPGGVVEAVRAVDVSFGDLSPVRAEMNARARGLREALVSGAPTGLSRCRWFSRGCEFRGASVCDCRGDEPEAGDAMLGGVESILARPDVEQRVRSSLAHTPGPAAPPSVERFRDLIYPRRAWFERSSPAAPLPPPTPSPESATPDVYGRLVEAIESGPVGEVCQLPVLTDEPAEEVTAFRGEPYLVRTSRAWERLLPSAMVDRYPQYALDLGFRCAATGSYRGRVVTAYERAERDEDRISVYELRFATLTPFSRLFRTRTEALRRALRQGDSMSLPPCPEWMYADCPYRGACGCGVDEGRSQR